MKIKDFKSFVNENYKATEEQETTKVKTDATTLAKMQKAMYMFKRAGFEVDNKEIKVGKAVVNYNEGNTLHVKAGEGLVYFKFDNGEVKEVETGDLFTFIKKFISEHVVAEEEEEVVEEETVEETEEVVEEEQETVVKTDVATLSKYKKALYKIKKDSEKYIVSDLDIDTGHAKLESKEGEVILVKAEKGGVSFKYQDGKVDTVETGDLFTYVEKNLI